jgi:undecaprenyl diphosphate synthase
MELSIQGSTTELLKRDKDNLPKHVALIPDGNRRWARSKNKPITYGHDVGLLKRVPGIIEHAFHLGIKEFSIWLFSTENWKRDQDEVEHLMYIYNTFLTSQNLASLIKQHNIRIKHLGREDRLPKDIIKQLRMLEGATKSNVSHKLNICLDYGGRDEIVRGVNKLIKTRKKYGFIDEIELDKYINQKRISDPDLVIRTSGELRISGFMIWESAYSEYYFEKGHMPDFTPARFNKAILSFINRQRRFGGK